MANGASNSHWNKLRDVKNCDSNPPISPRERIVMHPVCMYDALFPGMVVDELEAAGYGARPW